MLAQNDILVCDELHRHPERSVTKPRNLTPLFPQTPLLLSSLLDTGMQNEIGSYLLLPEKLYFLAAGIPHKIFDFARAPFDQIDFR